MARRPLTQPDRRKPGSYGRRYIDRKWPRHLRDFWLLILAVIVFFALYESQAALNRVQEGRQTGTAIQCAILSAIGESGKATIEAGSNGIGSKLTRFLENHGYPSLRVRLRQAVVAGDAYVRNISSRIDQAIGVKGSRIVRSDGTINCRQLARLANVPLPK